MGVDWHLPLTPAVKRLITVCGLLAFALTWLADIVLLTRSPDPFHPATNWLPILVTGPVATLAALETRFSPPLLRRIWVIVVMSLALSCVSIAAPQHGSSWGALESAGLAVLVIRTTAQTPRTATAAASAAALIFAVLTLPVRRGSWSAIVGGGYVLTVVLAAAVTLGCAIRALEARRRRAITDVRQAERLALARDLHDLIAHHMTGIIVQAHAATAVYPTAPDKVEPILRNIARAGTLDGTLHSGTWGRNRRARSTHSTPSAASPTTSMPGCASRIMRKPARTSSCSSAITTSIRISATRPFLARQLRMAVIAAGCDRGMATRHR
ncbi:Histidine kinase [Streptomyces sp. Ncost-T10-10d]|nr:Histidine kinase [Streptomyces sp. Ncost-T10-10d]